MSRVADLLSGILERPVLDSTGLPGNFDFSLKLTKYVAKDSQGDTAAGAEADLASMFTAAVKEQLGLRLNAQKGPVEVLVIDIAEKATEN